MSTTFEIVAVDTTDITFGQVIETAERHINTFLESIGITHWVELSVSIHDNNEDYVHDVLLDHKFEWSETEYA